MSTWRNFNGLFVVCDCAPASVVKLYCLTLRMAVLKAKIVYHVYTQPKQINKLEYCPFNECPISIELYGMYIIWAVSVSIREVVSRSDLITVPNYKEVTKVRV